MGSGLDEGFAALGAEPWRRLPSKVDWKELVLPDELLGRLRQVPELYRSEAPRTGGPNEVRRPRHPLCLLFGGSSGVGKTSSALALARELDLPVLEADARELLCDDNAPELVARLLSEAAALGAILVLDNADAALEPIQSAGARGHVIAPETLRLLRLDGPGSPGPEIIIFCVALVRDASQVSGLRFDCAFLFPDPDASAREKIWAHCLPVGHRVSAPDVAQLARVFRLVGASIAHCCATADRLAREDGAPVSLRYIADALEEEYRGRLISDRTRAGLTDLRRRGASVDADRAPVLPGTDATKIRALPQSAADETPAPARSAADETPPPARRAADETPPPARRAADAMPVADGARGTSARRRANSPRRLVRTPSSRPPARPHLPRQARPVMAAIIVIGALVAAALGIAASSGRSPSTAAPLRLNRRAVIGTARLAYPSNWRIENTATVSGQTLSPGLTLVAPQPARGRLVIGVPAQSQQGIPTWAIPAPRATTAAPQVVTLGARRYFRILALTSARENLYATIETSTPIFAACQTSSATFARDCEQVLGTLVLAPAPAPVATPDATYARQLAQVLSTLNQARTTFSHQLVIARTAPAQARAAGQLTAAHLIAANSVSHLNAGSAAVVNQRLLAALERTARAYGALTVAASAANARKWAAAERAVASANASLTATLAQLRTLGYAVS